MNTSWNHIKNLFVEYGVQLVVAKPLAENDNSKQQVYLGKGFDVLTLLPYGRVRGDAAGKRPNFKAPLQFFWAAPSGHFVNAPFAQLILYPDYPEVRLSGFLRGCTFAPSSDMQPVAAGQRGEKGSWDGRVLWMGVTPSGEILAALSSCGSEASAEFQILIERGSFRRFGVLYSAPLTSLVGGAVANAKNHLLATLSRIHARGWIPSQRLHADGTARPYMAVNGGGYTLESLLSIKPNGRAEPDYLGWEVKAFSQPRITLMTPEPDGGFYGEHGVEAFVRKYGKETSPGTMYFTGVHRVGTRHTQTSQLLSLEGYDSTKGKIVDVNGGIHLWDEKGLPSAIWSYPDLITHWGRKHANAVYVPFEKSETDVRSYRYLSPVLLGNGTDFTNYLSSMCSGRVMYDPACKVIVNERGRSTSKARNQFRMNASDLNLLYHNFGEHQLGPV
ncbi:MvaI/BcnI restriction endonuclease family protein [Ramlibacter terrae]|uniref:MvaI/BcnI restriction endonuclease family protein n=1 Tax=Ramlibacter terrae TaxID=2732511 RepID=A0ABX6NZI7_9BURK|nr:MvaI/BcnI restriction endonuclease family protein [Ramlibacter terrae]